VTTTWHADDVLLTDPTRHAAYLCLTVPASDHAGVAALPVAAVAHQPGLRNECDPGDNHPPEAIAFLRRLDAAPADIDDNGVLRADAAVHVASDDGQDGHHLLHGKRHTYFLPRYDDSGWLLSQGHALASEAGIARIMRRFYTQIEHPAPPGTYDGRRDGVRNSAVNPHVGLTALRVQADTKVSGQREQIDALGPARAASRSTTKESR
jgi:hypothetical protein